MSVRIARALLYVILFLVATAARSQASPGALDPTFGQNGFAQDPHVVYSVNDVRVDPQGRILVSGDFQGLGNAIGGFGVARFLPNGMPDNAFGSQSVAVAVFGPLVNGAISIAVQPDGKILAAGVATLENPIGAHRVAIARFSDNGSLDATFGSGGTIEGMYPGSTDAAAGAVLVLPSGKILIGGGGTFGSLFKGAVMRLNPNGSIDSTFGSGGVTTIDTATSVSGLGLQADDKIVALAGSQAVRLQANGALDLNPARGTLVVETHTGPSMLLPDERILLGQGLQDQSLDDFDTLLTRRFPDGSVDPTFVSPEFDFLAASIDRFQQVPRAVTLQSDGAIIVAGNGENALNSMRFAMARFHKNGRFDTQFGKRGIVTSILDGDDEATAVCLQPNGDILIAGKSLVSADLIVARYLSH